MPLIITIKDVRKMGYCPRAVKQWIIKHGFSWQDFLKNGIEADLVESTGDAMAKSIVKVVRESNDRI